jgi:glucosamine--fructose-6-phosphate aminotransferase (isomerizing)
MAGFLTEIDEQPAVLRATVEGLRGSLGSLKSWRDRLRSGALRRVIFSGMGASSFAPIPAQIDLVGAGIEALAIESSELLYYQLPLVTPDTLLVLTSQSGRSVEIIRLLETLNGRAPIIAITNSAGSPLAEHSRAALLMQAGEELTVSTKTFTCTLATLHLLVTALTGGDTDAAADEVLTVADHLEARLPDWKAGAAEIVKRVEGCQTIQYLGRGHSMAAAMTGALITKESTKFPTEGMSAAQFRHGPLEITDSRISAFVFTGSGSTQAITRGLAAEMAQLGGRVTSIGAADPVDGAAHIALPPAPDRLRPILEIAPVHHFAAAFAAHQGYVPGTFRYITKVTTTE